MESAFAGRRTGGHTEKLYSGVGPRRLPQTVLRVCKRFEAQDTSGRERVERE
jgi:hypothetical protein